MRDRETIDSELRLIALRRQSIREQGGQPSCRQVDELLDERLAHRAEASETEAVEAGEIEVVADTRSQRHKTDHITRHGRKAALRRFGSLAALPLSLLAVAAALVVMFADHKPEPAAQPAPETHAPPPSVAQPSPPAPGTPAPPVGLVDIVFVSGLKQVGVPVPSQEYVMSHGHAVCDFLAQQPNLAEAARFVQQSSIWDAKQSTDFAIAAVVTYCPQYESASPGEMEPAFQNALSDLQAIQRDLQGIQGNLQGIQDNLPPFPGQQ
jgi:Protein of unknown function (DUF732)